MTASAPAAPPPAVIAISSHVARGSVGNRSVVFALETLGIPVWSVTTVSLPFHPGHGKATRIAPDDGQFAAFLDDLASAPWIGEVGAVLTGYMASPGQAEASGRFVSRLRRQGHDIVHLCDPIIGDHAGPYVPGDTAAAIRECLLPCADIATPNLHELGWLAGGATGDLSQIARAARGLGPATVVVTSAPAMMRGHIANLLVEAGRAVLAEHRLVDGPPNGPGDLTAGLYLARLLLGETPVRALENTTASVFEMVARAASRGSDELMLAVDRARLIRATAPVNLRSIHVADPARQ